MASSGNFWQVEEEAAVGQTFREVFHGLPPSMQKMPKDPSRKWPHIKEIAKKVHPRLPEWLQDDRSMNAIKFRVPLAWHQLQEEQQEEQVQRLTDENGALTSGAQAARAKEQEATEKMRAACAKQQEDAAKAMQMSHEIEGLKRKLTEEANLREEANKRARAQEESTNALLYESGQALWKIMSHLKASTLPRQAAGHTEIQHAHPQLMADAGLWQPVSIHLDMQLSHAVDDDVHLGAAWSMPIARAPRRRLTSVAISNPDNRTQIFGPDDPEI